MTPVVLAGGPMILAGGRHQGALEIPGCAGQEAARAGQVAGDPAGSQILTRVP